MCWQMTQSRPNSTAFLPFEVDERQEGTDRDKRARRPLTWSIRKFGLRGCEGPELVRFVYGTFPGLKVLRRPRPGSPLATFFHRPFRSANRPPAIMGGLSLGPVGVGTTVAALV